MPVVSGSANTAEEDDTLQEAVRIVMDTRMNWDREDEEARQMHEDAKAADKSEREEAERMQQIESQRSKKQMLDFKARCRFFVCLY